MGETPNRRTLLDRYGMPPEEIAAHSLAAVRAALPRPPGLGDDEWELVVQLVYACGDLTLADNIRIAQGAIAAGVAALANGAPIVTDVKMVRAGIRRPLALQLGCRVRCAIDAADVVARAEVTGRPRAAAAMRQEAASLNGAVVAIGNAPTALLSLLDMVDATEVQPAVIIGMPVGFTAAAEAKDALQRRAVPYITIEGTRGGSPLAAATVNFLLQRALTHRARTMRTPSTAILFLGHGSRAQAANQAMEMIARTVQRRAQIAIVECGYLEMSSPTIPEALQRCIERGAERVIAIPYFLHVGMHMIRDLPRVLKAEAERYPNVQIVLGRHFGTHPDLAEIILDRIEESLALPDIRQATIDAPYYGERAMSEDDA